MPQIIPCKCRASLAQLTFIDAINNVSAFWLSYRGSSSFLLSWNHFIYVSRKQPRKNKGKKAEPGGNGEVAIGTRKLGWVGALSVNSRYTAKPSLFWGEWADPESESSSLSTAEEVRREGDAEMEEREAEDWRDGGRSRIESTSTREVQESPIH